MPRTHKTTKAGPRPCRVDLHIHSSYSRESELWLLRRAGIGESNTEPEEVYRLAKERGMTYVTLTDHNTIGGALTLAHHEDFFISEEVTTFFPEDGVKLHVLVLGITEQQHAEISELRANLYDLVPYLRREGILYVLAHPLTRLGGELEQHHIERLMLLFPIWEVHNGSTLACENVLARRLAKSCTATTLSLLADKYGIAPVPRDSITFTGGSDDHGGLDVASACTMATTADGWRGFLAEVGAGRSSTEGAHGGTLKLAHSMLRLPGQSADEAAGTRQASEADGGDTAVNASILDRIPGIGGNKWLRLLSLAVGDDASNPLKTVMVDKDLRRALKPLLAGSIQPGRQRSEQYHDNLFAILAAAWSAGMRSAITGLSRLNLSDLVENLDTIGRLVALQGLIVPYSLAANYHSRQRHFLRRLEASLSDGEETVDPPRVALFTDTHQEINGVTSILNRLAEFGHERRLPLEIITCGGGGEDGLMTRFAPVTAANLTEFGDLTLAVPPVLELLKYCEEQRFEIIHAATPGPMGLVAFLAARILQVPFVCSFHTDVPRCICSLTGDKLNEEIAWTYTRWFYGQSDLTLVPSVFSSKDLAAHGLDHRKMAVLYQGVDSDRFSPSFASQRSRERLSPDPGKKIILYVGRLSAEKDLRFMAEAYLRMVERRGDVHLAIVGDGPQRRELEELLGGSATFTGWLAGDELAGAYASADLFVFPSTVDTAGQVILEAQASGLPVVLCDEGGGRENIEDDVTGLTTGRRDQDGLIRQMETILDDDTRRGEMGRQARSMAISRTWERVFSDLFSTYGELLDWWRADIDGRSRQRENGHDDPEATAATMPERPVFPDGRTDPKAEPARK